MISTDKDLKWNCSNKRILSPIQEICGSSPKRTNVDKRASRKLEFSPNRELVPSTSMASFSPTLGLPNFVVDGTAPHLSNSPRKSKENMNWLTEMRKRKNACKNTSDNLSPKNLKTPTRKTNRVRSTELRKMSKNSSHFMPAITNFYTNLNLDDAKVT
jgi:denticleless